jgi:excisionase family DNA binding protein
MKEKENETYYTTQQVAAKLNIGIATVQKHIREGHIKTVRPLGLTRVAQSEIDRLLGQ